MKRVLFCVLCLVLLAGCGAKTDSASTQGTIPGITELTIPQSAEPQITVNEEKNSVRVLQKDGAVYGFEMRFPKSPKAEELLSDQENYYYGILAFGKESIPVPTEEIRVLTDIETHEFVVTLLLPSGTKLKAQTGTVSLCISPRNAQEPTVLFKTKKEISVTE